MTRAALSYDLIIDKARTIVEATGPDGLTLARVAEGLGVRAPSLYKHVSGLVDLRRGVMLGAKAELATVLRDAVVGRARDEAIHALAEAYRTWALSHPNRYQLTVYAPQAGDDADEQVSQELLHVVTAALRGFDVDETERIDAIRHLRAILHGFISLETSHAFELDHDRDRSFRVAIDSLIRAWARS